MDKIVSKQISEVLDCVLYTEVYSVVEGAVQDYVEACGIDVDYDTVSDSIEIELYNGMDKLQEEVIDYILDDIVDTVMDELEFEVDAEGLSSRWVLKGIIEEGISKKVEEILLYRLDMLEVITSTRAYGRIVDEVMFRLSWY